MYDHSTFVGEKGDTGSRGDPGERGPRGIIGLFSRLMHA